MSLRGGLFGYRRSASLFLLLGVVAWLGGCGKGGSQVAGESVAGSAQGVSATASAVPAAEVGGAKSTAHANEVDVRFKQAAAMLHIRQYRYAATALHRVLELSPNMPEAHVNMGYAMLGMERYAEAAASFNKAIRLKSSQANAYYGLALASYKIGDLEAAIGALNSFIRLSPPGDPYVNKARSALAEWRKTGAEKSADKPNK